MCADEDANPQAMNSAGQWLLLRRLWEPHVHATQPLLETNKHTATCNVGIKRRKLNSVSPHLWCSNIENLVAGC